MAPGSPATADPPPLSRADASAGVRKEAADRAAQMAMLGRLAEIGMGLAEDVARQSAELGALAAAEAYVKLAQSIRRAMLLQDHLSRPADDRPPAAFAKPEPRPSQTHERLANPRDERVADEREGVSGDRPRESREALDSLAGDLQDMRFPGADGAILRQPVGAAIAGLCRDLGVEPNRLAQPAAGGDAAGRPQVRPIARRHAHDPGLASWWARQPPLPGSSTARPLSMPAARPAATGPP